MNKNKIINFDFQGWPIEKMNLRDIIKSIGAEFNTSTGKWEILENDLLDVCPMVMEDDGMGYGVNQQFISEFSISHNNGEHSCNVFRESELNYPQKWIDAMTYPGQYITLDDKEWEVIDIDETDEGFVFKLMEWDIDKFATKSQEWKVVPFDTIKNLNTKKYDTKHRFYFDMRS